MSAIRITSSGWLDDPVWSAAATGAQAHHLTHLKPRAIGRKVSDEFTVPLCSTHHRELHGSGNEKAWWSERGIDPAPFARALWQESR